MRGGSVAGHGCGGRAGVAHAATHAPNGFVVIDSCTGVSGKIIYSRPGEGLEAAHPRRHDRHDQRLRRHLQRPGERHRHVHHDPVRQGQPSAANFSGTFTINWPASSGFNPSNGNLTVTESNGLENVSGSVTSGFDTGTAFAMQYVITGSTGRGTALHPVTAQTYTSTQSPTLSRNEG